MSTLSPVAKRCVELSYCHKLTHVSSVLNTVDVLHEIYRMKKANDVVILGHGHAGLALYVVLESLGKCDAEQMIAKHGVHPSRDVEHGIMVSSGSLGQAETVSLGFALADSSRTVWLVTSDGSCNEGAVHEVARIARRHVSNLRVTVIYNGFGAYGRTYTSDLPDGFIISYRGRHLPSWLRGQDGHYLVLDDSKYMELMR